MLHSMTGFGRYYIEDEGYTETWEVRSVNSRHLDLKWRLPSTVRSLEAAFEKVVRKYASRGRIEISLNIQFSASAENVVKFNADKAGVMLQSLTALAKEQGEHYVPDYNRLLGISYLWEEPGLEPEGELGDALVEGLKLALEDWNESRTTEARALEQDIMGRILRMEEWTNAIEERAPGIKEDRVNVIRERISQALTEQGGDLDENRFLQEITILADKLDVSEELTRLKAHLDRLRELLKSGKDAGRRLDFTMQECFREINTCGNKIQDAQISRLVVDFKNELEKCREQVQNIE